MVGTATYDFYLFQRQYTIPSRTPTPTYTPTPTRTPSPLNKHPNTTAVIAGSVAGSIALVVAGLSGFVLLRRRGAKNDLVPAEQVRDDDKMPAEAGNHPNRSILELPAQYKYQDASELTGEHGASEMWNPPVELPASQIRSPAKVNGG